MEGLAVILFIWAGIATGSAIVIAFSLNIERKQKDFFQGLHRSLLIDFEALRAKHESIMRYKHAQEIARNIKTGKARKK